MSWYNDPDHRLKTGQSVLNLISTYWKTKKCQAGYQQIDIVLRAFLQFCLPFSDGWFYSYFHSFKHVTGCRIESESYMYKAYSSPVTSDIFMLGWIRSFLEVQLQLIPVPCVMTRERLVENTRDSQ